MWYNADHDVFNAWRRRAGAAVQGDLAKPEVGNQLIKDQTTGDGRVDVQKGITLTNLNGW